MSYEPDRLQISDKEASNRFWLKTFVAVSGVLGFATIETFASFLAVQEVSAWLVLPIVVCGVVPFMITFVWLFHKPKHTAYCLEALNAGQIVELHHQLKHDVCRSRLLEWVKEDYPVRVWDKHELLKFDDHLQLRRIHRGSI